MRCPERRDVRGRAASVLLPALLLAAGASGAEERAARLAESAARLREALPADARRDALHAFADDEREDVRFAPLLLEGARHGALPEPAASLAEELLALSLSARGHDKARQIRRNERAVAQ